jgi:hypothetical protein
MTTPTKEPRALTLAWHFVGTTLRDGRPVPPDGEWLIHDGPVVLCESGLHASEHPFDALKYAPGPILCRVELGGGLVYGSDKVAAPQRRIIARIDATALLLQFARTCALSVIHLWNAPDVVRQYLETGDETIQQTAYAAAYAASVAAAADAAYAAADAAADAAYAASVAAYAAYAAASAAANRTRQRQQFADLVEAAFATREDAGRRQPR